jgi:hypothetical protein
MSPRPCGRCGLNFMPTGTGDNIGRLCNSCLHKIERKKTKKTEESPMTNVQLKVDLPREVHIEMEEICINKGINFSQYVIKLHQYYIRNAEDIIPTEDKEKDLPKKGRPKKKENSDD